MKMIQSQFPPLAGFHNCLLGQNLSFPVTNEAFIDSVHSLVSTDTKLQIASLLRTGNQRITLKIQKVQFQKGASDCDAYAIAFATDLAYGNNPASREYEQTKLQSHYLECLSKKKIVPFPS